MLNIVECYVCASLNNSIDATAMMNKMKNGKPKLNKHRPCTHSDGAFYDPNSLTHGSDCEPRHFRW